MGLINLCGAFTKKPPKTPRQEKSRHEQKNAKQESAKSEACTQYVNFTINGKCARMLVDIGAEVNLMTKTETTKLGLRYSPSNA